MAEQTFTTKLCLGGIGFYKHDGTPGNDSLVKVIAITFSMESKEPINICRHHTGLVASYFESELEPDEDFNAEQAE
jgi:hypothetical protein